MIKMIVLLLFNFISFIFFFQSSEIWYCRMIKNPPLWMIDSRTSSRSNKCAKWNSLSEKMSRKTSVLFSPRCFHLVHTSSSRGDGCVCVCVVIVRSVRSLFFVNGWYDFKRCYKTERLVGLNKIIALSQKLTKQEPAFGHEEHLTWNHMRQLQLNSFLLTDVHNRKMRTIFYWCVLSLPGVLMAIPVHHSHTIRAYHTHTKLVIWFLIFHIFESIDWYGEM